MQELVLFYNVDSEDQTQALKTWMGTPLAIEPSQNPLIFILFRMLLSSAMYPWVTRWQPLALVFAAISDTCFLMGWI